MANSPNSQHWFQNDPEQGMRKRIARIQRMRDPGTFADEILSVSSWLLLLSLLFTGSLCFFSYKFFLERFLSPEASFFAAVAVTVLIEVGKKFIGMSALRMPFMQGWAYIGKTKENTGVFLGAAVFAIVVFAVSVYNSTNGAARYAQQQSESRTETAFTPDTKQIDEQIAGAREAVKNAPKAKWKGTEYYQDKKSVRSAEQTITTLSASREKAIAQQRADFERSRDRNDTNNEHSGQIALRIGGWLEAIQIILMLLMASCERVLDRRNPSGQTGTTPQGNGNIGFRQSTNIATAQGPNNPPSSNPPTNSAQERQQIGFHSHRTPAPTGHISVAQSPQPVPQENVRLSGQAADDAIAFHYKAIKKEPSNFGNKHATAQSVAKRIHTSMDKMANTLKWVEWCSNSKSCDIVNYLEGSIIPLLNQHGFPYDTTELYSLFQQKATGDA